MSSHREVWDVGCYSGENHQPGTNSSALHSLVDAVQGQYHKKRKKIISPKHKFFICQIKGTECCPHIASLLILLIYFRDFSSKQKEKNVYFLLSLCTTHCFSLLSCRH